MTLPIKKRAYRGSEYSLAKRVRLVEAATRRNKPELKHSYIEFGGPGTIATNTASVTDLTEITQGTNIHNREAQKIKVYGVEIRGDVAAGLSCYLIRSSNGRAPTISDFTGGTVSSSDFLDDDVHTSEFSELWFYRPVPGIAGVPVPLRCKRRFAAMDVCYGTSSLTPVRNSLYFVIINKSGSTLNYDLGSKIFFTD